MNEGPAGFRSLIRGPSTLIAREDQLPGLDALSLTTIESWTTLLGDGLGSRGRGANAVQVLSSGLRVRLKQLRRGGLAATLWRDRFAGTNRLMRNLTLPIEARRRGVPTPAPVALFCVEGPRGFFRGWLALEEVSGVRDLAARFADPPGPDEGELKSSLAAVRRMHDVGVDHPDLNLGNLLVGSAGEATNAEAFVVDLDGARLFDGSLEFRRRQRALRRLERSYVKQCAGSPGEERIRNSFYTLYCNGDEDLARRFSRGRAAGRRWIGLHRLGWRR